MLSIELGTEILKQGTNLKLSGAERITDMIIEKKQEEKEIKSQKKRVCHNQMTHPLFIFR
jgi:hypothetical protein